MESSKNCPPQVNTDGLGDKVDCVNFYKNKRYLISRKRIRWDFTNVTLRDKRPNQIIHFCCLNYLSTTSKE